LRRRESARQAALIDSLPANIALLDACGVVIAVNAAWRLFADERGARDFDYGVGANYLSICERTQGDDARVASQVAGGIRNVLSGSTRHFSLEYPCHTPSTQAWFLLTVTPLDAERPERGAVVMHLDITERKLGEESLRRFAVAMRAIEDAVFLVDRTTMRIVYVNDAACRLQMQTRQELLATEPWVLASMSRTALEEVYDDLIAGVGSVNAVEVERRHPNGSQVWLEVRRQAQRAGELTTVVTLVRDITQRKEAQIRFAHLHRVYAMLSGINTLIVRVRDRDELFRGACRVAVDEGGFPMSWIGVVDRQLARVVPVASAGIDKEFFAVIEERLALHGEPQIGESLTSRAVREKRNVVCNDLQNDPKMVPGARHVLRVSHSMAIFPLLVAEEVVGELFLYARELGFFHADRVRHRSPGEAEEARLSRLL
jgi:PAS domain S-box-containing protein